jgi:hypothetical protein
MNRPSLIPPTALVLSLTALATPARATPSSNMWAPSTSGIQGFGVLHLTYDSYFAIDALYPVDLGLTMGVLPFSAFQAELGVDVLYPTPDASGDGMTVPIYFNGKLGEPEDLAFAWQPAWSAGIYNVGFEEDVTDYDILYGLVGHTLPFVGAASIGGYYGLNENLLMSSDGKVQRAGLLAGWFSPPIDLPVIDNIHFVADVQTGKNSVGAAGAGIYVYFTPAIDLATGPVFFFDPDKQPGKNSWMWSAQLDVDLDLTGSEKHVP